MGRLYCIIQVDPMESHESLKVKRKAKKLLVLKMEKGGHEPRHVSGL